MAVFAMEAASIISERSLEISFASALSTVSASGVNVNAGKPSVEQTAFAQCTLSFLLAACSHVLTGMLCRVTLQLTGPAL